MKNNNLKSNFNIILLCVLSIFIAACEEDEIAPQDSKTKFHSYNFLLNSNGDTLVNHTFNLEDDGNTAILAAGSDIVAVIAGFDREKRLWGSNFITTNIGVWDTISTFYIVKEFTLEEMNLDDYDHGDLRVDEVIEFIDKGRNHVNKSPYKIELIYDYLNPVNGKIYTNKISKDKFLLPEYRFTREMAGVEVQIDTIEKVEVRGHLRSGGWIETFRLKGRSSGYLHNQRNWSDSLYVEGAFDLLFPANLEVFGE